MLAFEDFLEAANGFGQRNVRAGLTRELLGDVERLREELLQLAGARDGDLVLFGQLVHAENRDDVLQILVAAAAPVGPHARPVVVLIAHDLRVEDPARGVERIDRRVDAELRDRAAEHGGRVEVAESSLRARGR